MLLGSAQSGRFPGNDHRMMRGYDGGGGGASSFHIPFLSSTRRGSKSIHSPSPIRGVVGGGGYDSEESTRGSYHSRMGSVNTNLSCDDSEDTSCIFPSGDSANSPGIHNKFAGTVILGANDGYNIRYNEPSKCAHAAPFDPLMPQPDDEYCQPDDEDEVGDLTVDYSTDGGESYCAATADHRDDNASVASSSAWTDGGTASVTSSRWTDDTGSVTDASTTNNPTERGRRLARTLVQNARNRTARRGRRGGNRDKDDDKSTVSAASGQLKEKKSKSRRSRSPLRRAVRKLIDKKRSLLRKKGATKHQSGAAGDVPLLGSFPSTSTYTEEIDDEETTQHQKEDVDTMTIISAAVTEMSSVDESDTNRSGDGTTSHDGRFTLSTWEDSKDSKPSVETLEPHPRVVTPDDKISNIASSPITQPVRRRRSLTPDGLRQRPDVEDIIVNLGLGPDASVTLRRLQAESRLRNLKSDSNDESLDVISKLDLHVPDYNGYVESAVSLFRTELLGLSDDTFH